MAFSDKTKRVLLIIAICILFFCGIWSIVRQTNSERRRICTFLYKCGYEIFEDDLLIAYDQNKTTIKNAIGKDKNTDIIVNASKKGGYPSRIDKEGDVTLILAADEGNTIYLYMLDGKYELCFIETKKNEIKALVSSNK